MNDTRRDFSLNHALADMRRGPPSRSASLLNEQILKVIRDSGSATEQVIAAKLRVSTSDVSGQLCALLDFQLLDAEPGHPNTSYRLSTTGKRALERNHFSLRP